MVHVRVCGHATVEVYRIAQGDVQPGSVPKSALCVLGRECILLCVTPYLMSLCDCTCSKSHLPLLGLGMCCKLSVCQGLH